MSVAAVEVPFSYVWRWRAFHPERYGKACRIVGRAEHGTRVVVEFEDGRRELAARSAVRASRNNPLTSSRTPVGR